MTRKSAIIATLIFLMTADQALAHVGAGSIDTLAHGFWHPLSGADHILAMVAVGLFAANLGGSAIWLVPSAFVATMMLGGTLGYYGWPLPMVEEGIGASVVVMGLAIAFGVRLPTSAAMALVASFAVFHGHAHGDEGAGLGIAFVPYAAGFVCATALLHLAGIALGLGLDRFGTRPAAIFKSSAGIAGAFSGVFILIGLV